MELRRQAVPASRRSFWFNLWVTDRQTPARMLQKYLPDNNEHFCPPRSRHYISYALHIPCTVKLPLKFPMKYPKFDLIKRLFRPDEPLVSS